MPKELLTIFKALSDDTRIDIVKMLASKDEFSCQDVSKKFDLSQPALSHHFSKLLGAEIILDRKEGTQHFYRVNWPLLRSVGIDLKKMLLIN